MNQAHSSITGVARVTVVGGILYAVATVGGFYASRNAPHEVLAPMLKYTIGVIGVAWLFSMTVYNKLSDLTDISGLDFRQHRNIEIEIHARLHWFWLRAIFLGILATVLYVPTILAEAKISTPDWVFGAAFGSLALSFFSLRRLFVELEDIRQLKSHVKEMERRETERSVQIQSLKEDPKDGWLPDPNLNSFRGSDDKK